MPEITAAATPPGWYPDAIYPGTDRWWSGVDWTDHIQRSAIAVPPHVAVHSSTPYGAAHTTRPYAALATVENSAAHGKVLQYAITALVFGIVSMLLNPFFLATLVAVARGVQARRRARDSDGVDPLYGRGLALWGLWLGVAGIGNGVLLSWAVISAWSLIL